MAKLNLLDPITTVFEQASDCKLNPSIFTTLDGELAILASYFRLSKPQALFVAVVYNMNYKGTFVSFSDLLDYFKCVPSKLLEYSNDFETICSKRIFVKQKSSSEINIAFIGYNFSVTRGVSDAILDKRSVASKGKNKVVSEYSLIYKIFRLAALRNDGSMSTSNLFKVTKDIISKNLHFPIIKMVSDLKLNDADQYFYIFLLWITLDCEESGNAKSFADMVFDNTNDSIVFLQSIASQKSDLFRLRLIETAEAFVYKSTEIKLSDESSDMLRELNVNVPISGNKKYNIIKSQNIFPKELYFNPDEQNQLNILKSLLEDVKFSEIQNRLNQKGHASGIAVLFHGFPGTGKTESVYQIAKQTGREVIKVDISQARSKWHGESEKIIKKIFNDYYSFSSYSDKTPILLFNEADAILSSRITGTLSDISKSENNIQNIILEELESFRGIFIATTNIVMNLDRAFERRFLFKIEFGKPTLEIKSKIWKSKFPCLNDSECNLLSNKFNFTGGQIDNILKKKEIGEILSGKDVEIETLIEFCCKEEISKTKTRTSQIGFINQSNKIPMAI